MNDEFLFFSFAGYGFCSETLGPGALREIINFILDDQVGSQMEEAGTSV